MIAEKHELFFPPRAYEHSSTQQTYRWTSKHMTPSCHVSVQAGFVRTYVKQTTVRKHFTNALGS